MINFNERPETIHDQAMFAKLQTLCLAHLRELAEDTTMSADEWFRNLESCITLYEQIAQHKRPLVSKSTMQELLRNELTSPRINADYIRYIISLCK